MSVPQAVLRWQDIVKATLSRLNYQVLDYRLVLAVIWQESSGNPWAWNPEPRYRWFWDVKQDKPFRKTTDVEIAAKIPPGDFPCFAGDPDQEWWAQQASWSLMQIMGAAAREQGFRGNYLPELCEPYSAIEYGIRHLWNYAFQKGNRSTVDGLLRYNGGGDPNYPSKIIGKRSEIERV